MNEISKVGAKIIKTVDLGGNSLNSTPTNPFDAESNFLLGDGSGDT